jgi:lactobin A/cerein 7B family class IIb bacteriocin
MQELNFSEVEEVSGGIIPVLVAAAAIAGGAVALIEIGKALGKAYYYATN